MSATGMALAVTDARKTFGDVTAVDGVSFDLGASELAVLVGPSGCGKSTLLRAIAGLVPLDHGRIVLGDEVVDDGHRHRPPEVRRIGLVFQEHALFPHLSVADNISFGIRGGSRGATRTRVGDMLALVGLSGYERRFPHELSGGERQRVALARALAPEPRLLLLDEPFASLDPNLRGQLRLAVVSALRATETPAVFVTHDQVEALAIGDRIAVMRKGRICQFGTPEEVFHRPVSRFVGSFMGEASFLPMSGDGDEVTTVLGPIDAGQRVRIAADAGEHQALVRPDDIRFERGEGGAGAGEGTAPAAVVRAAEYRGDRWCYTLELDEGCELRALGSHLDPIAVGERGRAFLVPGHHQVVVPVGD